MDFDEREILFNRIITGLTNVGDYIICDPTPLESVIVQQYYKEVYYKLIINKIPTEDELVALLIERKLWSDDNDIKIKDLNDNLKKLRKQLSNLEFKSNEKKQVQAYIDHTKKELNKLNHIKDVLLQNSAEYLAKLAMYKKYLFLLTKKNNKPVWTTWNDFLNEEDSLIIKLIQLSFFNPDIDAIKIRELARTEPWRSIWIAGNKIGNLFDRPLIYLTTYQRLLVSWSIIYDNAYESTEFPGQYIIENDDLFDQWMEDQNNKRDHQSNSNTLNNIKDGQEVGIMVDTFEDAQKVYKLNNQLGLNIVKNREKQIIKQGEVEESRLEDKQQELRMLVNQNTIKK